MRRGLTGWRWRRCRPLLLTVFMLGPALVPPRIAAQTLIVNPSIAVERIDQDKARLLFSMRINEWSDRQPVKVFVLPDDHPLHRAFSKSLLGLFPYQLRRVWDRQLFSGTGQAPTAVASEADMLERVASTPGAIGYVERIPVRATVVALEVD